MVLRRLGIAISVQLPVARSLKIRLDWFPSPLGDVNGQTCGAYQPESHAGGQPLAPCYHLGLVMVYSQACHRDPETTELWCQLGVLYTRCLETRGWEEEVAWSCEDPFAAAWGSYFMIFHVHPHLECPLTTNYCIVQRMDWGWKRQHVGNRDLRKLIGFDLFPDIRGLFFSQGVDPDFPTSEAWGRGTLGQAEGMGWCGLQHVLSLQRWLQGHHGRRMPLDVVRPWGTVTPHSADLVDGVMEIMEMENPQMIQNW